MSLPDDYLAYPWRQYGNDHNRYDWSMLTDRPPVQWPNGKRLAVWVNVSVEFYPLNQRGIPFKVPNGMTMPYPDLRHYSLRDYGNRVGIYRFLKAFDRYNITPTFALNGQIAERYPSLLSRLADTGAELLAHGWNMDHLHYGGQDKTEEAEQIKRTLDTLRKHSGQSIEGWLSPAKNQSENTPDLLTAEGVRYCCDWVNDDMPYPFRSEQGDLMMMPLPTELEDQFVIGNNLHSEDSWVQQVKDAFDFLMEESATQGGRMLGLNIHPWMMGQPHRIASLEAILEYISGHEAVWQAGSGEILRAFQTQQDSGREASS
ncbi:MAG: polysaccharide deacetylase family protein [Saccharospirillum sp.]|uniref:polysaccharide deacetylase family protein n=1 Tax=Saccharospirillum sp. TaxID=2033801 RepID=UPI003298FAC8